MYLANARKTSRKKSKAASKPSRHRKHAAPKRAPAKRRTSHKGKGVRTALSKSGIQWEKTPSGQWVKVGEKKSHAKGAYTKKSHAKTGSKKPWPKRGSKKMGRAVAGVEARVSEDLVKAQKLVQSARYRVKNTSKAAGGKNTSEKLFTTIVKGLEKLITQV